MVCEAVAGEDGVYLPALYDAECYVAWRVGEMSRSELLPPDDLDKLIARIQRDQGIRYAPQQREAVELAACRQVMLLTGGPGTGKTTSLRGCWPCSRPWGWRPPWRPPLAGGQAAGGAVRYGGIHHPPPAGDRL